MRLHVLPFLLIAAPALAETPLSAAEFDAYTQGRTLTYSADGIPFGIEEYLPDRRVRWSFLDGECVEGTWYEAEGLICFAYEAYGADQCWTFFHGPGGLMAQFENDPDQRPVYETFESPEPMQCLGPKVGV
jgi:hypothetical protein